MARRTDMIHPITKGYYREKGGKASAFDGFGRRKTVRAACDRGRGARPLEATSHTPATCRAILTGVACRHNRETAYNCSGGMGQRIGVFHFLEENSMRTERNLATRDKSQIGPRRHTRGAALLGLAVACALVTGGYSQSASARVVADSTPGAIRPDSHLGPVTPT